MTPSVSQLEVILEKISAECKRTGRDPADVDLVTVSKTFAVEAILPLLDHGWRRFGENRVQEAQTKWPQLIERYQDVELHLIGPLQSNKTADAVALFDVIQTVDREKIAKAIGDEMRKQKRQLKLFVQVNTGNEPQKTGLEPKRTQAFVEWCRNDLGLTISGLMCIPPFDDNPGPHFALLNKLAANCGVSGLSMGMSSDYEVGIELGATHVRVGSAIFGARN